MVSTEETKENEDEHTVGQIYHETINALNAAPMEQTNWLEKDDRLFAR